MRQSIRTSNGTFVTQGPRVYNSVFFLLSKGMALHFVFSFLLCLTAQAQSGWKTNKDGHMIYEYKPSNTPTHKPPVSTTKSTPVYTPEKEKPKEETKKKTESELIEEEERKAGLYEDRRIIRTYNYRYGYNDEDGRQVIARIYSDAKNFSEGLAAVELEGKWGYINNYGQTIIPFKYYSAGSFKDGKATVYERFAVRTMEIDKNGEEIIKVEEINAKPVMPAAPAILLNETFSVSTDDWPSGASGGTSASFSNGRYILENAIVFESKWFASVPLNSEGNYTISLNTRYHTGDITGSYGLYFGAEDSHSGFGFCLRKDGRYRIDQIIDSKQTIASDWKVTKIEDARHILLKDWTASIAIKKGPAADNLLSVKKIGTNWKFYINNQLVTTIEALPFYGTRIGVSLSGIQKASFDNLIVKTEL